MAQSHRLKYVQILPAVKLRNTDHSWPGISHNLHECPKYRGPIWAANSIPMSEWAALGGCRHHNRSLLDQEDKSRTTWSLTPSWEFEMGNVCYIHWDSVDNVHRSTNMGRWYLSFEAYCTYIRSLERTGVHARHNRQCRTKSIEPEIETGRALRLIRHIEIIKSWTQR